MILVCKIERNCFFLCREGLPSAVKACGIFLLLTGVGYLSWIVIGIYGFFAVLLLYIGFLIFSCFTKNKKLVDKFIMKLDVSGVVLCPIHYSQPLQFTWINVAVIYLAKNFVISDQSEKLYMNNQALIYIKQPDQKKHGHLSNGISTTPLNEYYCQIELPGIELSVVKEYMLACSPSDASIKVVDKVEFDYSHQKVRIDDEIKYD